MPDCFSQQAGAPERHERLRNTVDEDRDQRTRRETAEHEGDGLGESMIDGHAVGYRSIDIVITQVLDTGDGRVLRYAYRACKPANILCRPGGETDTERRHGLQEKTVEVVRTEGNHQFRVKFRNGLRARGKRLL